MNPIFHVILWLSGFFALTTVTAEVLALGCKYHQRGEKLCDKISGYACVCMLACGFLFLFALAWEWIK
jgi:hypothetical protein